MLFLSLCFNAKVVAFEDIQTKKDTLAALFYDSKAENKQCIQLFEKYEKQYQDAKFYLIDKQEVKNEQAFQAPENKELPQLYILMPDEHLAEPMRLECTEENFEKFFKLKFAKIQIDQIQDVTSSQLTKLFDEDAFIIFVDDECERCNNTKSIALKAAMQHKIAVKVVSCSQFPEFCEDNGVYHYPTTFASLDGVPSNVKGYGVLPFINSVTELRKIPKETRKQLGIQKQKKNITRGKTHYDEILLTETKQKLDKLEHTIDRLTQQVQQLLQQVSFSQDVQKPTPEQEK